MDLVIVGMIVAAVVFIMLVSMVVIAILILQDINKASDASAACAGDDNLNSAHTLTAWAIGLGVVGAVAMVLIMGTMFVYKRHGEQIKTTVKKHYDMYKND